MKNYKGFMILNFKTQELTYFNYIKGVKSVICEENAIKTLIQKSLHSRCNFAVHQLIKK